MSLRRAAIVLIAMALVAAPATAAEATPQVTDDCGDAGTRGEWNDDSMDFEETRPYLDLKSGGVGGLYDQAGQLTGFTAAVTVCGEASAEEGGYSLGWYYGDSCWGHVSWTLAARHTPDGEGIAGHASAAAGRTAQVTEDCYRESTGPLDNGVDTIYSVTLPEDAVVFDGDTVTFTVAKSLLPAEAGPRFATGAEWAHVGAVSMDQGPSLWAGYGDSEGNTGRLFVRTDFALGGASYFVGQDAAS